MNKFLQIIILIAVITISCNRINDNGELIKSDNDSIKNTNKESTDTILYAIPIGSKFSLDLIKVDEKNYRYKIIDFEEIDYSIDEPISETLFKKRPIIETIDCYFAKGTYQSGPFKIGLFLKNNTKNTIYYEALISYTGREGFYKTNVVPLYSGIVSIEWWGDDISAIVIKNLTIDK